MGACLLLPAVEYASGGANLPKQMAWTAQATPSTWSGARSESRGRYLAFPLPRGAAVHLAVRGLLEVDGHRLPMGLYLPAFCRGNDHRGNRRFRSAGALVAGLAPGGDRWSVLELPAAPLVFGAMVVAAIRVLWVCRAIRRGTGTDMPSRWPCWLLGFISRKSAWAGGGSGNLLATAALLDLAAAMVEARWPKWQITASFLLLAATAAWISPGQACPGLTCADGRAEPCPRRKSMIA